VDQLIALRGTLATPSDSTVQKLDAVLPQGWSQQSGRHRGRRRW
jgi:acetyltransferase